MKKIRCCLLGILTIALISYVAGCGDGNQKDMILHLGFDEGSGAYVEDSSGNQEKNVIEYNYSNAVYSDNMEPQWKECGAYDKALLFDGNSTYIKFDSEKICLSGEALTISVWVAPRCFEWDDPNAKSQNREALTAIVSQYNKEKGTGVLLGYQRYGKVCFQVGAEDGWHTVWGDANLNKDEWNYLVASYDGKAGEIHLYLNGELVGKDSVQNHAAIVGATKQDLLVGKNSHATAIAAGSYNMFSGLMDELCIYDEVLSEENCIAYEPKESIPYEEIGLQNILGSDKYKTQYHGGPYQHWMNEPHGPMYYNGMYHLFFQQNMMGAYWRNIQWGHLVSKDMVNWKPVKEAICPTENSVVPDGVWSGNAAYDKNGVPLLFFTAGNDSFKNDGLLSNQNIGVAYPKDLEDPELIDWVIYDELAVEQNVGQGRLGEFRDPYIWKEGDTWCMFVCSGAKDTEGGTALLYTTDRLELMEDGSIDMEWKYRSAVYEMEDQSMKYGTSWELPIMVPLTNTEGTITKYAFLISPAPASTADNKVYFFLGDFDLETGKFIPDPEYDNQPGLIDYGDNVFTGPSVMTDPLTGKVYLYSIMQDKRNGAEEGVAGWAHCVGLTREIYLSDDGTDVWTRPIEAITNLEAEVLLEEEGELSIDEVNQLMKNVAGDLLHVTVEFAVEEAKEVGLSVKSSGEETYTRFVYGSGEISGETTDKGSEAKNKKTSGKLVVKDGSLTMDVYIDRSLVEAYFNQEKSICVRSYSDSDAQNISVLGEGGAYIKKVRIAEMTTLSEAQ